MLFPHLRYPSDRPALRVGDHELTHAQLAAAACDVAARLDGCERVAVWAENSIATAVGVVGALVAGVPAIPVNPKSGPRELQHILGDSQPAAVLAASTAALP